MKELENLDNNFLAVLLKAFFRENKAYIETIVNFDTISKAVNSFQNHFQNEDKLNLSNHSDIIKKIFEDEITITDRNCNAILGVSLKTFYRYKERYMMIFRNYLIQGME